ncbi:unnamed protein product [Phytomonas sp. EM1]|nr:unnamed protein product [Phytomonas sp. EM1]|eukprot:CCW64725.1 unnamed protein product [Phytomonas sp. isolate EM1]
MMLGERAKVMIHKYHGIDWLLFVILAFILFFCDRYVTPHCRPFQWDDPTISYPHSKDTFGSFTITLIIVALPVFYFLFEKFAVKPLRGILGEPMSLYSLNDVKKTYEGPLRALMSDAMISEKSLHHPNRSMAYVDGPIYSWIRAHLWACLMELFLVDMLKLYAGRLRPDYLARLAEANYSKKSGSPDPKTEMQFYCQLMHTSSTLRDGRMSFPSGHSSSYFAVFTIMSFFLFAHLRPFARQGSFIRLLIALSPLSVAFICAVSRTRDHKHNFSDISVGSVLGVACAILAFSTSFRVAGGPLTVYLARSEIDVEYLRHYRSSIFNSRGNIKDSVTIPLETGLAAAKNVHYQSTARRTEESNSVEYGRSPNTEVESREAGAGGAGHAIVMFPNDETDSRSTGLPLPRNMLVTELELNENSEAVSWL